MTMWKMRNCPRCQGDLFIDKDLDGWYEQCLQCGYRREMRAIAEAGRPPLDLVSDRLPNSGVDTPEKRRSSRGEKHGKHITSG
jgi:ribosomal protein S27AE